MSPDLLKSFFRAGVFVAGSAIFLLFIVEPESAEFVITVASLCVGIMIMAIVFFMAWLANR